MKGQQGFTLTELLVVLVLMAVLLTMVVPSFAHSWQQVQMDVTIEQLHRDLRWAQRMAAREQRQISVNFLRDKQPYRYVIMYTNQAAALRRRELPYPLDRMESQTIFIRADKTFRNNGHILFQKGEEQRYVYYYQTGRTRITKTRAQ